MNKGAFGILSTQGAYLQSAERDESVQRDEEQAQMEQKREGTIWNWIRI